MQKLRIVADTTQPKMHRKRGYVQLRKVIRKNILTIREEIVQAANVRKNENNLSTLKLWNYKKIL